MFAGVLEVKYRNTASANTWSSAKMMELNLNRVDYLQVLHCFALFLFILFNIKSYTKYT